MNVTIITASFNSALSIKTCLDSVVHQNYNDIEYLIIDGKSSDATLKIIKVYQQKFPFIKLISEKDSGIYDALNKGVQLASGDIIGFVHSDDFLEFNDIIYHIVSMTKSENLDGVYGDLQYVDKSNTKKIIKVGKVVILNPVCLNKDGCHPTQLYF